MANIWNQGAVDEGAGLTFVDEPPTPPAASTLDEGEIIDAEVETDEEIETGSGAEGNESGRVS